MLQWGSVTMPDDHHNGYTVRRLAKVTRCNRDRWAITKNGETVATVDYKTARLFWLGRLTLAELVDKVGGDND